MSCAVCCTPARAENTHSDRHLQAQPPHRPPHYPSNACTRTQTTPHPPTQIVNATLDTLIARAKALVDAEGRDFEDEFLSEADPSILHFLVASGDDITSKQLRDDLMTLLIAGHETTAAVLTWTMHLLADRPDVVARIREEVRVMKRGGDLGR